MARPYTLHPRQSSASLDFAKELNPQQLEAVTCSPGPALVIAGAGSGKTRTLTHRVAWLISQGHAPSSILLLTFTNKAAREMLERVSHLMPGASDGVWGGTFHSIGNRILRRHAEDAGFREGFSILDRDDQEELLDAVVAAGGFRDEDKSFPKAAVLADLFSYALNTCRTLRSVVEERYRYFHRLLPEIEQIFQSYEERKRGSNSMDFDDLLLKFLLLLKDNPSILQEYQKRFRHILVDEYQDTNTLQAELIDLLASAHRSIMVVGDDAQSIYSWRGADCANILEFPRRYPGAKIFKIETNYRSVPEVLALANATIAPNRRQFEKNLSAIRPPAEVRPAVAALPCGNDQAAFVAQRIEELVDEGTPYSEIAVLYRAHFHSMELQMELTRRGIPFSLTSGIRFFEQAHIKDVSAFLKLAVNPRDEIAFRRIVRLLPGVGAKSAESLWIQASALLQGKADFSPLLALRAPAKASKHWPQLVHTLMELSPGGIPAHPSDMIRSVLLAIYEEYLRAKYPNADSRREDLETLANFAKTFEAADDFLAQLALMTSVDPVDQQAKEEVDPERVTLSSIHQAKGLEWNVVFVIYLAEGMFPNSRSLENEAALEEERRLFYVAVTRCKDLLYLTFPEFRSTGAYGEGLQRASRFLIDLPEDLREEWDVSTGPSDPESVPPDSVLF